MRHYTRLSNGFSRRLENHEAAVALNYLAYNFHQDSPNAARQPAMAAGVTSKLWEVCDLVALLEASEWGKSGVVGVKNGLYDMDNSGTLGACPMCDRPIEPFGAMRHRFAAEDLDGEEICIDCARRVAPEQVAFAEDLEREWAERERGS